MIRKKQMPKNKLWFFFDFRLILLDRITYVSTWTWYSVPFEVKGHNITCLNWYDNWYLICKRVNSYIYYLNWKTVNWKTAAGDNLYTSKFSIVWSVLSETNLYLEPIKAYSQISNRGHSQKFQIWIFYIRL